MPYYSSLIPLLSSSQCCVNLNSPYNLALECYINVMNTNTPESTLQTAVGVAKKILTAIIPKGSYGFAETTDLTAMLARCLWLHANITSVEQHTVSDLHNMIGFRDILAERVHSLKGQAEFLRFVSDSRDDILVGSAATTRSLRNLVFVHGGRRGFMHYGQRIAKLRVADKYFVPQKK